MSVNKVILLGHLGGQPELRYFPDGTPVCNFSLATSERWKDKQTGERKEATEWHRVSIRGKLAEIANQYLAKGSKVYIEGRLQTREWEKDGIKRYTTEVVVDIGGHMQMLDSSNNNGAKNQNYAPQSQQRSAQGQQNQPENTDYGQFDGDIPF